MSIKVFDNQHANSNSSFWAMVSTSWHYQINLNTTYDRFYLDNTEVIL